MDPGLEQVVYRALALRPEDRYPTAVEFLKDLSQWVPDTAVTNGDGLKASDLSEDSKTALGPCPSADEDRARKLTRRAAQLARHAGGLMEAADLMEEALNLAPHLREEYESQLKLWRRGVAM